MPTKRIELMCTSIMDSHGAVRRIARPASARTATVAGVEPAFSAKKEYCGATYHAHSRIVGELETNTANAVNARTQRTRQPVWKRPPDVPLSPRSPTSLSCTSAAASRPATARSASSVPAHLRKGALDSNGKPRSRSAISRACNRVLSPSDDGTPGTPPAGPLRSADDAPGSIAHLRMIRGAGVSYQHKKCCNVPGTTICKGRETAIGWPELHCALRSRGVFL